MKDLTAIIEQNIDRATWKKWKFSDLVENIVEKVVPKDSGLEHYIGLEHLDSGSLKIRRFGETSSLVGDKLKIYKGDLIFAKRNAYLKRVAIAEFDAVASAHSLVLRANPKNVLPEFLPFFLLSEKFWERAIEISVGSLSPTINWRVIAKQEFLLPPKDQQARLAELLWAMDEVVCKNDAVNIACRKLFETKREFENFILAENEALKYNSLLKVEVNNRLKFRQLKDVLVNIKYGTSKKGNTESKGFKIIGIPNVVNEKLAVDTCSYVELEEKEFQACKLLLGDIVIVRTNGNPDYTGRSALFDIDEEFVFASYLIKITVDTEMYNPEYLVRYLQTKVIRNYFRRHATSTAGNYNINTETIKSVSVPVLPLEKQNEIVQKLKEIERSLVNLTEYASYSKSLQKSLLNQIF